MRWLLLALALLPAACAYNPGWGSGPAYQEALAACRKTGAQQGDAMAKRRFYTFVTYPISDAIYDHRAVRDCLGQKGYKS
jgi:hypothetical protein